MAAASRNLAAAASDRRNRVTTDFRLRTAAAPIGTSVAIALRKLVNIWPVYGPGPS